MKLFDSHCHLDDPAYDKDIDKVINRIDNAGVAGVMIVGVTQKSSSKAVLLAESLNGFFASVGIHPHNTKECSEAILKTLRNIARSPKVRAWGEIGLDFNRMYSPRKDQEKWFIRQLEIADELNLPVIFHERDSNGRFLEILKANPKNGRKGVVHCFSGNRKELEEYLDLDFYIGITGILTIKVRGAALRKLVPLIPLERILIETDAPYLTPAPEKNRTRRNEPAFVKSTLFKLAEVRGEDPEFLSAAIWENTCRLFNLGIEGLRN
jgi:TatD DNase family protein